MGNADVDFVEMIVKAIATFPEDVHVERKVDERGVLLTLSANKQDAGKIIGKGGQTIIAIRILLRIIGSKMNAKIGLRMHDSLVFSNKINEEITG